MAITRRLTNFTSTQRGISGTFDVDLYIPPGGRAGDVSSNARIIITLKVFLRQNNNGDGRPRRALTAPYTYSTWPADKWETFRSKFADGANFWNNKFWLCLDSNKVSSPEYRAVEQELAILGDAPSSSMVQQKYVYIRNLKCGFNLQLVSTEGAAHCVLDCLYIVDGSNQPVTDGSPYRSNSGTMHVGDIDDNGFSFSHEVGHLLGLTHIGVITNYEPCLAVLETPEGLGSAVCYEGYLDFYATTVMGSGMNMSIHFAEPWKNAFERMSGVPSGYYGTSLIPCSPQSSGAGRQELIREGTPRWKVFMPNSPDTSSVGWRPGDRRFPYVR